MTLDEIDALTRQERAVLIARLEMDLLKPSTEYKWPRAWEKVIAKPTPTVSLVKGRKSAPTLRSKPRKSSPRPVVPVVEQVKPRVAAFTVVARIPSSMPFERSVMSSQDRARERAAEAL